MAFNNSANNVSSPVSLSKVTQVFSGVSNGSQRSYLRGSLPYPVTNAYSSIAASGTLTLNSFAAANNPPAICANTFLSDDAFFSGSATTQLTLSSSGTAFEYEGGSNTGQWKWLYAGHQADYDVRFTQTTRISGGGTLSGTTNTWLNLVTSRTWFINLPTGGFDIAQWFGTLEIRMNASPQTVISNSSFTMTCVTEL